MKTTQNIVSAPRTERGTLQIRSYSLVRDVGCNVSYYAPVQQIPGSKIHFMRPLNKEMKMSV